MGQSIHVEQLTKRFENVEAVASIDVASARQIRQLIADLNRSGTTIFLTTHYIEEAERLCDRIGFIVQGRIIRADTVSNLIQPVQGKHVLQLAVAHAEKKFKDALAAQFPELIFKDPSPGMIRVEADEPVHVGPLVRFLEDQGIEVKEARRMRLSLEDVFVQITGIEADALKKDKEKGGGKP